MKLANVLNLLKTIVPIIPTQQHMAALNIARLLFVQISGMSERNARLQAFPRLADSKVFLWFYATALQGAVDNSVKQISDVLNDEVKFKDY